MDKIKTLIILGNGFDLDLGWKTSYNDFFRAKQNSIVLFNGMSFIKNMVEGEYWYDLEGYIRHIAINEVTNKDELKKFSYFWRLLTTRIEEYLRDESIYVTNIDSCAYNFLNHISPNSKIVSFNYTNPFNICKLESKKIEYIHNSIESVYSNGGDIKLGIDTGVLSMNQFLKDDELSYILKSKANEIGDELISQWKNYDNIIIYGHSLGITDSDYFKPLFDSILSGAISPHSFHIVTKDVNSVEYIKKNLLKYDIKYSQLLCACDIMPVFTGNGSKHPLFKKILQIV